MTIHLCLHGIGINLMISVVDLSTGKVGPAKPVRVEKGWTVGELKQHIGEVREGIILFKLSVPFIFFPFFFLLPCWGIVF